MRWAVAFAPAAIGGSEVVRPADLCAVVGPLSSAPIVFSSSTSSPRTRNASTVAGPPASTTSVSELPQPPSAGAAAA
ncbi:hypothetical protein ACIHFC_31510 [Streptomyces sp. NPDC052013]|uniref:hypothetical protein n=1 Tax=Streptomyces sp. NPDC052013 TaxID=3365679 RepID=UPI0037D947CC